MMVKLYRRLRGLMVTHGDKAEDVAKALLLGKTAVSHRLNGHEPWSCDEMYILMDRYHVDYKEMSIIFPKKGIDILL